MFRPVEVSVEVPGGRATFRRPTPNDIAMTVVNTTPALSAALTPKLSESVQVICAAEIECHRDVFRQLHAAMSKVVSHEGVSVPVCNHDRYYLRHGWGVRYDPKTLQGELSVASDEVSANVQGTVAEGSASDASLAAGILECIVQARKRAVENLYRNISDKLRARLVGTN